MKHAPILLAVTLIAACGGPPPRPRTVAEFVEDPVLMQGVIARCRAANAVTKDLECANALAAADRIAAEEEARRAQSRDATFERERRERRERDEAQRAAADRAAPKFDPYSSPVANAPDGAAPAAPPAAPVDAKP
jgi:hypothetical protein